MAAYTSDDGTWRSLVARLLWEQEAPGSNPGVPTRNPLVTAGFCCRERQQIVGQDRLDRNPRAANPPRTRDAQGAGEVARCLLARTERTSVGRRDAAILQTRAPSPSRPASAARSVRRRRLSARLKQAASGSRSTAAESIRTPSEPEKSRARRSRSNAPIPIPCTRATLASTKKTQRSSLTTSWSPAF